MRAQQNSAYLCIGVLGDRASCRMVHGTEDEPAVGISGLPATRFVKECVALMSVTVTSHQPADDISILRPPIRQLDVHSNVERV